MSLAHAARSDSQAEAIRKAVLKSVKARDAYSEEVAALLFEALADAEDQGCSVNLAIQVGIASGQQAACAQGAEGTAGRHPEDNQEAQRRGHAAIQEGYT